MERMRYARTALAAIVVMASLAGCHSNRQSAARFESNLIDPDHPPIPQVPPARYMSPASSDELYSALMLLRHQGQYAHGMLQMYPGNKKALGVQKFVEKALPAYEHLARAAMLHQETPPATNPADPSALPQTP